MSMDDAVKKYRDRRAERIQKRNGGCENIDAVEEFRKRRSGRLEERMDAGIGWAYGLAKSEGIDTTGMTPKEVFEALDKKGISTGKNGPNKGGAKQAKAENKNGEKKRVTNSKSAIGVKESDGSGYKGKPGEVKSGKSGNLRPKSAAAKKIDTADAAYETKLFKESGGKKGREKNSLTDYIDANGNLSPERQKVHDEIIQKFFADKIPYDGKPTMVMSGGGPASGKSFIEKSARAKFGDDTTVTIDPDAFKAMLPGYAEMAKNGTDAAPHYHEESSALAKRAYQYAVDNGLNAVYDGTGDGSVKSVMKKLKTAQDAGYAVKGQYVTVDTDEAIRRNQARYEHMKEKYENGESDIPPRLPKVEDVRNIHAAVTDVALDAAGLFDDWELTDNNVKPGEERPVIARCKKGGEIEVVPGMEDRVQKWLDKGTGGAKVVNGKIVRRKSA